MPISLERAHRPFAVSKATVDHTGDRVIADDFLPKNVTSVEAGAKKSVDNEKFHEIKSDLEAIGITFKSTVGGNSVNAAHRIKEFRKGKEGAATIIVQTWVGSDGFRPLMKEDLTHPGMEPLLVEYAGETPQGLVVPRINAKGRKDRTIFSNNPEGLLNAFEENIPEHAEYAIINSLGGDRWEDSLNKGVQKLKKNNIRYAYTPGSAQLNVVEAGKDEKKINAIYAAIDGAKTLNVDINELKTLIKGKTHADGAKHLPATDITMLLQQGLELGAEAIFVTDGAEGAYAATRDKMLKTRALHADVVSTTGAGDAFMAGAVHKYFETEDLAESLLWGSSSGSYAVETLGAHENPPSASDIEYRLTDQEARVIELYANGSEKVLPRGEKLIFSA